MLAVEGLSKSFGGIQASRNVSAAFPTGSLSAIIGPNGAGKTTFFNLISGAFRPDAGRVILNGENIVGLSSLEIVRRGMARAFQVAALFPSLTVREALSAAVASHRRRNWSLLGRFPRAETRDRVDEITELLGLGPRADTPSRFLSHGDGKLLDIALALAMEPKVLLLDEPTAGMGTQERWRMIGTVQALWRATGMTVLFIEHDMDIVFRIAERIFVLKYGAVLAEGGPEDVRANPEVIEAYLGTDHHAAELAGAA